MSVNKVKIYHAETDQYAEVVDTTVPGWQTVGWTVVEDGTDQQTPVAEPNKAAPPETVVKTNGGPAAPDTSKKE